VTDVFVLQGLFGEPAGAPGASRHQGIHGAIAFPGLSGLPFLFPLIKEVITGKGLADGSVRSVSERFKPYEGRRGLHIPA